MGVGYIVKNKAPLVIDFLKEINVAIGEDQFKRAERKTNEALKYLMEMKKSFNTLNKLGLQKSRSIGFVKKNEDKFKKFNSKLSRIQKEIDAEAKKIKSKLVRKLKNKDFIADYEMEIVVSFYIGEDDPEYNEDDMDGNVLVELEFFRDNIDSDAEFSSDDHNDTLHLKSFKHCCLFHSLYGHVYNPRLSYEDLLRIKDVGVDIKVEYQKFYTKRKINA